LALILPGLNGDSAVRLADELRAEIKRQPPARFAVSASIGIASLDLEEQSVASAQLLDHCVTALVTDRQQGGDRALAFELAGARSCAS
jgi:GGDEF domain-containing protein